MPNVLVHTADESVTLSAQAVRRLLERGDGDAALLYLALLRHHGAVAPRSLAGELRWERSRIEAAEETLRALGLIAPAAIPEPADERPDYQQGDIARLLESSAEFRGLVAEVERRLKKELDIPVTVSADLPQDITCSGDLSIVLSNLVENALIASEKQPEDKRNITVVALRQGDMLNILVKNLFDAPVQLGEDGLPVTHVKGHGIGMKSLDHFRQTYDASVLCTYEDGWFSTYIRVPWGGAA